MPDHTTGGLRDQRQHDAVRSAKHVDDSRFVFFAKGLLLDVPDGGSVTLGFEAYPDRFQYGATHAGIIPSGGVREGITPLCPVVA